MDVPEGFREPNDSAFIKTETRTGPPLDYVSEKLRSCLEGLHELYNSASRDLPDDLPGPAKASPTYNVKRDSILYPCLSIFRYALISYLALNNLLALANEENIEQKLLNLSYHEFKGWLDNIEREGSVTGLSI